METTAPYSPSQNRIAECLNQTLLEHARAMIFAKNLLKNLWPEAVAYANYIRNWMPTWAHSTNIMPYQSFFGKKPDVSRLEEFGTRCWVMIPDQCCLKLDPKVEEHIFVRVAKHAKAWKYYIKIFRHVQTSRNITFDQNDTKLFPIPNEDDDDNLAPLKGETSMCKAAPEPSKDPDSITPQMSSALTPNPSTQVPKPLEIHRSTHITNRPDYWLLNDLGNRTGTNRVLISHRIVTEPENYTAAMSQDDSQIWHEAMKIEMEKLKDIGTWELVALPKERMAIRCQWVFAAKTKPDGKFDTA